jgi:hypothetical protein
MAPSLRLSALRRRQARVACDIHVCFGLPCLVLGIVVALPLDVEHQIALVLLVVRLPCLGQRLTLTNLCPMIFSTTYLAQC